MSGFTNLARRKNGHNFEYPEWICSYWLVHNERKEEEVEDKE